jgi:hypothetical protein
MSDRHGIVTGTFTRYLPREGSCPVKRTDLVEMENLGPVYYWQGVPHPVRATRSGTREPPTHRDREPADTAEAEAWRELAADAPPPPADAFWHPLRLVTVQPGVTCTGVPLKAAVPSSVSTA